MFFFVIGLSMMTMVVDARFTRTVYNMDKPPGYAVLSEKLEAVTNEDDVIVTNLDTWGSWYGQRKTIWLPLKPKQLILTKGELSVDAIYLTTYRMNDENYYLGKEWRQILDNPTAEERWNCEGCEFISENFELVQKYVVEEGENFENKEERAVLLVRKE
jgi:hypothetical protein